MPAGSSNNTPRFSFGVIVLNGEPFTTYCLRQLYPHAHEIIVVEGGSRKAAAICPEGHSTDGTREALKRFKAEEDPENKVKLIFKDGFWTEKDEQSQAYANVATGNYLWQVDVDEFYRHQDIEAVRDLLSTRPDIDTVSFEQHFFWGGFDYVCDSAFFNTVYRDAHRLFKWGPGYRYMAHRPPTVIDPQGVDLRKKKWVRGAEMTQQGIIQYHYSFLFPKQVRDKCEYYSNPGGAYAPKIKQWADESYFKLGRPFKIHNAYNYPSWLQRWDGSHPEQMDLMRKDIAEGRLTIDLRPTADIEQLLDAPWYTLSKKALVAANAVGLFRLLVGSRQLFKFIFSQVYGRRESSKTPTA